LVSWSAIEAEANFAAADRKQDHSSMLQQTTCT
jgi:hypothetical protein